MVAGFSHLYSVMQYRYLRVAIPDIRYAIQGSKMDFDCFAFVCLVKLNITSSYLKKATAREYKKMFHLSSERFRQLLSGCIERGYCTEQEDGSYLFLPFEKRDKGCKYTRLFNKYDKREKKQKIEFAGRLHLVKDALRKAILQGTMLNLDSLRQTYYFSSNPSSVQELKKTKAKRRCLAEKDERCLMSNRRMTQIAKCSPTKLQNIKREMIASHAISRETVNDVLVPGDVEFNRAEFLRIAEYNYGYIFKMKPTDKFEGGIVIHRPNIYHVRNNVVYFRSAKC